MFEKSLLFGLSIFILQTFFGTVAYARACKIKSEAADFKCIIKSSKKKIDIKYRYIKSKRRSASLNYLKDIEGPYARESFIVKIDPANQKFNWKNCMLFGLIGKCIRKKLKICDLVLKASHSESYGLTNKYKYKRALTFDLKNKNGSYTYFRRTPKASSQHRLEAFKVEFNRCKLIKKY